MIGIGSLRFLPTIFKSGGWCAEYKTVYDAFITKPNSTLSAVYNKMVRALVKGGYWTRMDIFRFYANHTNANGEALLNWKQPVYSTNVAPGGGTFSSSTGWSLGAGWSIAGGKATCDGTEGNNYLQDDPDVVVTGTLYRVTYTITDYTSGIVRSRIGGSNGILRSATGTYTDYFLADGAGGFRFSGSSFNGSIDNLSITPGPGATAYNAPTHTANQGFLFNGTTQYIDNNWIPSISGVNYTQNSASQILYIRSGNPIDSRRHGIFGSADSKDMCIFIRSLSTDTWYIRSHNATYASAVVAVGPPGLVINTRTASNVLKLYHNGSPIIEDVDASVGISTLSPYTGASNNDNVAEGFAPGQISIEIWMNGCSQADATAITTILETAMDSLGTGII